MKKLINKIPDRYYLISMAFILFIMVLGRYMFPDLMKKWDMVLYFLPQLFLPFTIIAVLYFYVKNNHSQAVIDFLTVNEDEIFMIINKKIILPLFLIAFFFLLNLHAIVLLLFPMFLYLHVKFAYKSNKFIQNLNNIYKIVHLIFLVYFNIHIYYGDYSYSQEINYEVILLLLVITSIYTVILSYFISKKIMYLYICLSIITAFFAYSFTSIHGLYYLALVFLIYYGLIYYKHILLSFMLLFAVLIFNNLAKFLSILVLFSVFASDDKSTKCPLDFNLDMIRYSDSYIYKHVNEYKYTYGVEYQFKTYYTEAHYLYNYFLSMDVVREEKGYFRIRKEYVHSKDKTYDNYNGIKVKDWCK